MATESYKPDVSPKLAQSIRLLFAGVSVALVLYGVAAVIFFQCVKALLRLLRLPGANTWSKKLQLAHIFLIFACGTIFMAADTWLVAVSSLDYPLFKGGPYGWILAHYNHPVGVMGNTSFEVTTWLADGFMLFRCFVVYSQTRGMWFILLLPTLLYLASIATGLLLLVQVSIPTASLYSNVNFGLTNFSLAAALNIVITILISGRLIRHRMNMQKALGSSDKESLAMYTSISTILVESSALYAAASLMFIVPYALNRPIAKFFLPILAQIQVISPLLVALRLAKQIAWTRNTTKNTASSIRFQSRNKAVGSASGFSRNATTISVSLEGRKELSEENIGQKA